MSFNFKKKLQIYIQDRIKEIAVNQQKSEQVVLDYAQISRLFPEPDFIPYTDWSISPSVILHILNDIVINKRQNIIEFGSGVSTLYIAQLIKTLKLPTRLYSVESNEEWLSNMHKEISRYGLNDIVTFVHATMVAVPKELGLHEQELWYDSEKLTSALQNVKKFDLVIVDGPFGSSTPYARYTAIPFLQNRLVKDYAVFLDDGHREEERKISENWAHKLQVKPQFMGRYTYFRSNKSFDTLPFMISNF
ncbi:class I SAM-dependent methyltransferase [Gelidibacter maritimus]|uniref:Class I SAM-dependent methyltransferase n=1 Tax=Gelidibacter maritimus TaxID=2761487 RepID=A0A7W2M4R4_9FLAO|nr:class I SAM-dependent methyltransferase [Gelidibacter maritimus]MBA6152692.1 class I SAM-dependent methyltransferase [Gelidibacter maritimus]